MRRNNFWSTSPLLRLNKKINYLHKKDSPSKSHRNMQNQGQFNANNYKYLSLVGKKENLQTRQAIGIIEYNQTIDFNNGKDQYGKTIVSQKYQEFLQKEIQRNHKRKISLRKIRQYSVKKSNFQAQLQQYNNFYVSKRPKSPRKTRLSSLSQTYSSHTNRHKSKSPVRKQFNVGRKSCVQVRLMERKNNCEGRLDPWEYDETILNQTELI